MSGILGGGSGSSNAQQQAPLTAFNVQTSAYGSPVPLLYGRNRLSANLIWYGDFTAIPHTQNYSAGKGGSVSQSSTTYTYTASIMWGLCEGLVASVNGVWIDQAAKTGVSAFTTFLGSLTQSAWSYLTTNHATQALNYRGFAYAAVANYDLGSTSTTGNHSFDITGLKPYSAGTIDGANPYDVLTDFLTDVNHGANINASLFGNWTQFNNYCVANNLFISPVYTSQKEARQHINDMFTILNSGVFFSEGKIKIVPFGDTAATANSVTYTPNTTPVFAFTDNDFLDSTQPVKVSRTPTADAFNQVQVEFLDATNSYNVAVVTAQDQASIELYGLKPMSTVQAHMITSATTARMVAQLILQRQLYTRNMYEFKVGWDYCQIEPCDYVTITDSRLGLNATPVRVLAVEEDSDGMLSITAEDAPSGVSHSASYTPPTGSGYVVDYNVPVANVQAPAFFEVPANTSLSGLAIGVAVTGQASDAYWGGCEVYVSNDGTSYAYMGRVSQPCRYGTLKTNNITSAVNQVARVQLAGRGGQLLGGSSADATNDATGCVIINPATPSSIEYVDYTTATLNATNDYSLTLAIRGTHNTTAQAHNIGDTLIRVDGAIAYGNDLDLSFIGKTLYFKFLSYNIYGGAKQSLASVSAYTYTVTGNMASLAPPAVTGLAAVQKATGIALTWVNPTGNTEFDHVEIWRGLSNITPPTSGYDATLVANVFNPVAVYLDPMPAVTTTYYYWVRSVNKQGYPSAYSSSVTATSGSVGGIKIVTALPSTTGATLGDVVSLTTDHKLYRFDGTSWICTTDGADILVDSVTAGKINVTTLAAINASLGSITSGNITLDSTSWIKGGQTGYNTGTGFFLGYSGTTYKFSLGSSSSGITWDGSTFGINNANINVNNLFTVNGSTGALAIKSAATGARLEIYNNVIKVFDASNVLRVKIGDLTA